MKFNIKKIPNIYWIILILIIVFVVISYGKTEQFGNGTELILFHSPQCPHCKSFMPIWNEIKNSIGIRTVKYDCTDNVNAGKCSTYNIRSYPTLILETNGNKYEYNGNRDVMSITNFVKQYN